MGRCGVRNAELKNGSRADGRCSALARRCAVPLHRIVNCAPAKGCVWPVVAPAEGIVRAGSVCGSGAALARGCVRPVPVVRFYRNVVCLFAPIMRSFRNVLRSITPAVCRLCAKQDGLREGCVPIPPWVGIAVRAFSNRWCGYRALWVHFGLARFFMAIPTEDEGTGERGGTEETGNGVGGAV